MEWLPVTHCKLPRPNSHMTLVAFKAITVPFSVQSMYQSIAAKDGSNVGSEGSVAAWADSPA
eukprot:scaffold10638_cov56-Prasinocladus_malaysianus.AAC.1